MCICGPNFHNSFSTGVMEIKACCDTRYNVIIIIWYTLIVCDIKLPNIRCATSDYVGYVMT